MKKYKSTTAIVYHFFAHYRKGVICELQRVYPGTVVFIADSSSEAIESSIKTYVPEKDFHSVKIIKKKSIYWLKNLGKQLKKVDADNVIFLGDIYSLSAWVMGIAHRLRGKKVYFWAHGWLNENEGILKAGLRQIFFKIPNGVLLYGRRARRIAVEKGFNPQNLHVIYNSLDYNQQISIKKNLFPDQYRKEIQERYALGESFNLIICSARLTQIKRFDLVIKAVSKIKGHNSAILFIGEGPEKENLINLSKILNVKSIFVGQCYDERELAQYFSAANVVVSPGNVGLTAMHALVYGIPVITHGNRDSQMPEVEAIIANVTGDFFSEGDSESLAEVLQKHFSRSVEEKLAMSQNCCRMIDLFFTPEKQVSKILAALENKPEVEDVMDAIQAEEIIS